MAEAKAASRLTRDAAMRLLGDHADDILNEAVDVIPRPGHRVMRPEGEPPPRHSQHHRLQDILDAVIYVQEYVRGRTRDDYLKDRKLRGAVERNIGIVSEAARRLLADLTNAHSQIP